MLKIIIRSFSGQIILAAVLALILVNLLPASMLTPTNPLTHFIALGKLLYIGLLKMFVGIVVLFALLQGITNLGSVVRLKTLGLKTLAIYSLTSSIAIAIGLSASLFMPKWQALNTVPKTETFELISNHASGSEIISHLLNMMLVNPFSALGNNNLLAIVFFAILLGVALLITLPEKHIIFDVINGINASINNLISYVIKLAPIAIFSIVFQFASTGNSHLFAELTHFSLWVVALTAFHGFVILPLLAKFLTGRKILPTLKKMMPPMALAFATASSTATLPLTIQTATHSLGISKSTSSVVLPLGSILNMDGTALFEGVAAIFLAQIYGIELGTTGIILVFLMSMLSSIGAPGMPSGSMSGMQLVLVTVGIPLEAIGILLLIERPLDTFRTSVNVEGDMIAAMIVDKWQR